MKRYRLSPEATSDIDAIADYYHAFSPKYSLKLVCLIIERCRRIGRFPDLGTDRSSLLPGLRSIAVEDHLIFFRKSARVVEIVRVLHGARDILSRDFG